MTTPGEVEDLKQKGEYMPRAMNKTLQQGRTTKREEHRAVAREYYSATFWQDKEKSSSSQGKGRTATDSEQSRRRGITCEAIDGRRQEARQEEKLATVQRMT